jgi:hypothetical protein
MLELRTKLFMAGFGFCSWAQTLTASSQPVSLENWPTTSASAVEWFSQKNERLYLDQLRPAAVTPEEDFFADPIWAEPMFSAPAKKRILELESKALNYRRDNGLPEAALAREILAATAEFHVPLARLHELSKRPGANPGWDYARGYDARHPHLETLPLVGRILRLQAEAALALGQSHQAAADAKLVFRLARALSAEPQLISLLVATNLQEIARRILLAGQHHWAEDTTPDLLRELHEARPTKQLPNALRGERGAFNHQRREMGRLQYPAIAQAAEKSGLHFLDNEHLFYNLAIQIWIETLENSPTPPDETTLARTHRTIEELRRQQGQSGGADQPLSKLPQGRFPALAQIIARVASLERAQQETALLLSAQEN